MGKTITKEAADIMKRLSPQNQAYFMTLVKVAAVAEDGVKHTLQEDENCLLDKNGKKSKE